MIKIAILEDDAHSAAGLWELIEKWSHTSATIIQLHHYKTAAQFYAQSNMDCDALFLDIDLQEGNGMEVAAQMRKRGFSGAIIFITNYKEYVFDGYDVHALYYLLKPATYDMIQKCMHEICQLSALNHYYYSYHNNVFKIPCSDIIYLTSSDHYVDVHTNSGVFSHKGRLKEVLSALPPQFLRAHRSIVVNIAYVDKIEKMKLYISNGEELPLSRTCVEGIRSAMLSMAL